MACVVTSACINEPDAECQSVCHLQAVHPGRFTRLIDPASCDDCGLCVPVCPVGAIYFRDQVPADELKWVDLNAAWDKEPAAPEQ